LKYLNICRRRPSYSSYDRKIWTVANNIEKRSCIKLFSPLNSHVTSVLSITTLIKGWRQRNFIPLRLPFFPSCYFHLFFIPIQPTGSLSLYLLVTLLPHPPHQPGVFIEFFLEIDHHPYLHPQHIPALSSRGSRMGRLKADHFYP